MKAFYEIENFNFFTNLSAEIVREIESKGKEYILGVDENEYIKYLIDKYTLEPLNINFDDEKVDTPISSKKLLRDRFDDSYQSDVYTFTIKYQFTGSAVLFRLRPNPCSMTTTEINVHERPNTVSFSFEIYEKNPEEFKRIKEDYFSRAFTNLKNVNAMAINWNDNLMKKVSSSFQEQKAKYKKENDFFVAINVKVNKDTNSLFTTPTLKKKIIPQPTVDKSKEFSSEPTMSKEMYEDVLKVIYDSGKSMERKPDLYKNKDEEGLRDQFLFVLETRYEGTTASGETFNRGGRTDIILKYAEDGSNLFVAECKLWNGESKFLEGISQLFGRYLTWHDSKTALLVFVKNRDFSNVLQTIKDTIKTHPCFVKEMGARRETSFSYLFRLPQDKDKPVYFEVIAFHYDK
jgi:hypothetical protein